MNDHQTVAPSLQHLCFLGLSIDVNKGSKEIITFSEVHLTTGYPEYTTLYTSL